MKTKITKLIVPAVMVTILAVFPGGAAAQRGSYSWLFDDPANYTYDDTVIEVSNSMAQLVQLPSNGFWVKTYLAPGVTQTTFTDAAIDPDGNIAHPGVQGRQYRRRHHWKTVGSCKSFGKD